MATRKHASSSYLNLIGAIMWALLVAALLLSLTQNALAALRPRLPPQSVAQPAAEPEPAPAGALIELRAQFPQTWPWTEVQWQDLWAVVQWQDDKGYWHDVEEWRGGLDEVVISEGREVVGKQAWWVAKSDLGKGPFRWLVCQGKEGKRLGTSDLFYLPGSIGETTTVEVSLAP